MHINPLAGGIVSRLHVRSVKDKPTASPSFYCNRKLEALIQYLTDESQPGAVRAWGREVERWLPEPIVCRPVLVNYSSARVKCAACGDLVKTGETHFCEGPSDED